MDAERQVRNQAVKISALEQEMRGMARSFAQLRSENRLLRDELTSMRQAMLRLDDIPSTSERRHGDRMVSGDCLRPWMFVATYDDGIILQTTMANRVFWHGHWVWSYAGSDTVTVPAGTYAATPLYIHVRCDWSDPTGITLESDVNILGTDQTYYRHLLTAAYLDADGNAQFATESPCWMGGHIHIATAFGPSV